MMKFSLSSGLGSYEWHFPCLTFSSECKLGTSTSYKFIFPNSLLHNCVFVSSCIGKEKGVS